jgi:predicted DNA-binding protein YlxM (UPF0122 family)
MKSLKDFINESLTINERASNMHYIEDFSSEDIFNAIEKRFGKKIIKKLEDQFDDVYGENKVKDILKNISRGEIMDELSRFFDDDEIEEILVWLEDNN